MKHILLFFLLPISALPAQEFFDVPTTYRCNYSGVLEEELIYYDPTAPVPEIVERILRATHSERNFELVQCNVESVAAVLHEGQRYLLYSLDFYLKLPQSERAVAYGLIAHEIGHHVNEHTFDPVFREKEELEADFFMGFALCKVPGITQLRAAMEVPQRQPYAYPIAPMQRSAAIRTGWLRSSLHVQVQENMAYESASAPDMQLPYFNWPPPEKYQRQSIEEHLKTKARTLGEVSGRLNQALQSSGYEQRSYLQVPNGFALVTQLEQFNPDGSPKSAENRWKDYPVQENFDGVWDYLKSLVVASPGHFRIFVFIVTDRPYGQSYYRVGKAEAVGWLSSGLNRLPSDIGKVPLNDQHYLDVLVYEFEAPKSNLVCQQKWPGIVSGQVHLQKTGLARVLRF